MYFKVFDSFDITLVDFDNFVNHLKQLIYGILLYVDKSSILQYTCMYNNTRTLYTLSNI